MVRLLKRLEKRRILEIGPAADAHRRGDAA
jgi:hypothetical protein